MIEVIIVLTGALLLLAAGRKPRLAPVPVRVHDRKR